MELERELPAAAQTEKQREGEKKQKQQRGQIERGRDRHRVHVVQRGAVALGCNSLSSLQRNPFTPFLQLWGLVSSLNPSECLFVFVSCDY